MYLVVFFGLGFVIELFLCKESLAHLSCLVVHAPLESNLELVSIALLLLIHLGDLRLAIV